MIGKVERRVYSVMYTSKKHPNGFCLKADMKYFHRYFIEFNEYLSSSS